MPSSRRVVGLLTVLTAVALTVPVASASAAETTFRDARGDVWRATSAVTAVPSPSTKEGDLTKAVVRYAGRDVKVGLRFVSLRKRDAYAQYAVRLQGKQGKVVRTVTVETSKRDRSGVHRVFNAKGREVGCDAGHHVNYVKDRVTVTLDRRCLSSPHKVRVNVNTGRATTPKRGDAVFFSDNVHDTAASSTAWSAWVERG